MGSLLGKGELSKEKGTDRKGKVTKGGNIKKRG